ncbi:MAG TPA: nuclear transport factor 2 family protein [Solirubrobacterales bacterium]|jgi:ketosteroid isomerase-like protein
MSEENVEVLRRGYAALAEGGVEEMLELTDPEFELVTPASLASEPGTFRGHDGVRAWFASFDGAMEGVRLEGRTFAAFGDNVFVETVLSARGRATGIETEQTAFLVWTVRDGLVVRGEAFAEREEALEAARSV